LAVLEGIRWVRGVHPWWGSRWSARPSSAVAVRSSCGMRGSCWVTNRASAHPACGHLCTQVPPKTATDGRMEQWGAAAGVSAWESPRVRTSVSTRASTHGLGETGGCVLFTTGFSSSCCLRSLLTGVGWILLCCCLGMSCTATITLASWGRVVTSAPYPLLSPAVPAASAGEAWVQDWLPGQGKYNK